MNFKNHKIAISIAIGAGGKACLRLKHTDRLHPGLD